MGFLREGRLGALPPEPDWNLAQIVRECNVFGLSGR